MDLLRFTLAPSVATHEAADTCASAADPAVPEARQAGEYTVTAAPAVAGQWQLIRNSEGESTSVHAVLHSRAQVPEARQAGEYTVTAAPAVAGQWQLIRNSEGEGT
jgi:hypothetical protein